MKNLLSIALGLALLPLSAFSKSPNVLLICIDDLRPELKCFGADHIHSPNIDRLAETGRSFSRHYVQAPTCGASRYALLTGRYNFANRGNSALFDQAKRFSNPPKLPTLPRHFLDHGYTTVSVGKISHHPGGRGGKNWDDDSVIEMPEAWSRHLQPAGPMASSPWHHARARQWLDP